MLKKAKNWKIGLIVVLMMLPVSVSNIHADFCDNEEVVFQQEQMIDETDEKITENNEFDTSAEIEEPQQTDAAVQNEKSDGENFICEENSPIANGEASSDMENEELLTSPEEETAGTAGITDGVPEVSEAPQQTESLTLAVEDYNMIAVKSIPIGALSGAIFMIIGFAYLGIVHIFKKV